MRRHLIDRSQYDGGVWGSIFHVDKLNRMFEKTFWSVGRCSFSVQSNILVTFFSSTPIRVFFTFLRLATGRTVRVSNPHEARFSAPVQPGPGANLASYTIGTGSFMRAMRPGCGVDHPPQLESTLREEYSYNLLPLWVFVACFGVKGCGVLCK